MSALTAQHCHVTNHDTLAFVDAGTATRAAAEIRALAAARTWGEASQMTMIHLEHPAGPERQDEDPLSAEDVRGSAAKR
ncbi:hypothetical protein ACFFKH_07170 [Micromonospora marina]|uniref:Uncharacterized protein n=1 Tax=Micromonospora marina TaxID=307120 RepID=A0A1C4VXY9_9ACTN|nr:hypothetical protein [Micromonospora marina]SCE88830.1 hypothetical protein GA0070215_10488 [Micromonospora marina]